MNMHTRATFPLTE